MIFEQFAASALSDVNYNARSFVDSFNAFWNAASLAEEIALDRLDTAATEEIADFE